MTFIKTEDLPVKQIVSGFDARFIHTGGQTLAYVKISKGSILPEHAHIHEQVTHVLEGQLELSVEGETKVMEPGLVAVIPSNHRHSGIALTDCIALDVFCPEREDYKAL